MARQQKYDHQKGAGSLRGDPESQNALTNPPPVIKARSAARRGVSKSVASDASAKPSPAEGREQLAMANDAAVGPEQTPPTAVGATFEGATAGPQVDVATSVVAHETVPEVVAASDDDGMRAPETDQAGDAIPETVAAKENRTTGAETHEDAAAAPGPDEVLEQGDDAPRADADDANEPRVPLKVLVCSHSHPEISKGGAEIAAFALFRGIGARDECRAWFLGCDRREKRSDIAITQPFGPDDYLYSAGEFDWFKFANRDSRLPEAFATLLGELRPDVVHFHHYINFGVEVFQLVRRVLPRAKIVVTLHEYLAICNHHGQMVTHPHRNLCYEANPVRCVECFKQFDESDFFLRQKFIAQFFGFVDHFVSPSGFLRDRYVAWGLPADGISVIENVVRPPATGDTIRPISTTGQLRVGFFGQLSFLKGAKILFEAAQRLEKEERTDISIEVYGDYRSQPPDFQKELLEQLEKVGDNIKFHGPYDQSRVDMLMQSVDAVIVPSVWWENSPLVIQEAFRNGRPVICSDIGGMAEKVRDGIDGFHFPVGSPLGLAALLKRLADERTTLAEVATRMQRPPTADMVVDAHLAVYRSLRDEVSSNAPPLAAE
ncbi:MAG: glycosyltransferase [Rhodospirillales bacterium]|nr:glycosyltransferase [Rhodospirillales bacterium]